ncbi:inositol-3-phosphate synthase [Candidatus Peregrinibacteria bacterium]|nr:inositol-3-phosphate synthase [Candidatus Peregrinibacteria bacterium]
MAAINIALIGVGNCAKSLLEGIGYYTTHQDDTTGLMHPLVSGYHPSDIHIVAAFDIDERKVGKNILEAMRSEPNRTTTIGDALPSTVVVQRGPTHDSIIPELREFFIHESKEPAIDVAEALRKSKAETVINYLPTGSDKATYAYAEAALAAGCNFINCMPTPIAKDPSWRKKFEAAGLVLMGDDIKSQLGATILNRTLLSLLKMRGVRVISSDQVNYGGNADHFNLHYRPHAKEASKEAALTSMLTSEDARPAARMSYTEKNYDHKRATIKIQGKLFGHAPVSMDIVLEDEDSPNSGGVVVDAVRMAKVLREKGMAEHAGKACAFLMKSPPVQMPESEALAFFDQMTGDSL